MTNHNMKGNSTRSRTPRTPKLRHHKTRDLAFVEIQGKRTYLGAWGSPEAEEAYHRLIAEWKASGCRILPAPAEMTVNDLILAFAKHAEVYYRRPDGTPTNTSSLFGMSLRPVRELYGRKLVGEFGPLALEAVRDRMIEKGWARTTINSAVGDIRHVFRWGVAKELVKPDTLTALESLPPLRRGRSQARETEPVRPVPEAHIEAIGEHVSAPVWALIQLQLLTGARAGELVGLRPIDLDTSGKVWTARLEQHKKSYAGRERVIYFGPKAQEVIRPFLCRDVTAAMFSPREGNAERKAKDAASQRRPNQAENPRKTTRTIGEAYTTASYRKAIQRACSAAGVPKWSPHMLRHTFATNVRKEHGIEVAAILCGHKDANITTVYAEADRAKALQVAAKIG